MNPCFDAFGGKWRFGYFNAEASECHWSDSSPSSSAQQSTAQGPSARVHAARQMLCVMEHGLGMGTVEFVWYSGVWELSQCSRAQQMEAITRIDESVEIIGLSLRCGSCGSKNVEIGRDPYPG